MLPVQHLSSRAGRCPSAVTAGLLLMVWSAVILLTPAPVWSASFRVYPTKVFIDAKSKSGSLRITNEAEEPLNLELRAVNWEQDGGGKDQYSPSDQLLFFPKIVTLKPKEERVVRVAYRGAVDGTGERTFRMVAEEMPSPPVPGRSEIKVLIRATVPVFVMPEGLSAQDEVPEENWSVQWAGVSEGKAAIVVRNDGRRHLVPTGITLTASQEGGDPITLTGKTWYVLGSRARTFEFPLPEAACRKARDWKVEVVLVAQVKELTESLTPESQACAPPAQDEKAQAMPEGAQAVAPGTAVLPAFPAGDEGEQKQLPRR